MALVAMEGFDFFSTAAQFLLRGWSQTPNSFQTGRFSGQCARFNGGYVNVVSRTLPSSYATLITGFAVRFGGTNTGPFFALKAAGTNAVRLQLNASQKLIVVNSSGTTIATGTTTIAPNVWYYIELKAFINGASGTCELKLNGISEIASTAGNFGSTNIDALELNANGATGLPNQTDYDDIYVVDTTGAAPRNTFLGDVRVQLIQPTADGAHSAWSPNSGSTHYNRVNETSPDDDTTFVSDATPGDIDTFVCADIDAAATVLGVQTNLYARKDDAAARQIAPVVRQAAADYVGATVTLASTYAFYSQLYNQDPTGADWTAANVNADEFGVKEIA